MKNRAKFYSATLIAVTLSGLVFAQNPKLTDPEIVSIAIVSNQIAVNFARYAKEKSKNTEVLGFAETMIRDHQSAIDQANALAKKLGITPMDNPVSKKLNSDADASMKMLRTKSGADFDKAFIDHEVTYHMEVRDEIQNQLIPQAKNAELKDFLQKILPVVKTHLSHAEMIQKSLAKK
jgi:putative membrane protein